MIRRVVCYLGSNQVAEGYYTYDGGIIQMVFDNGVPVVLDDEPVIETVGPELAEAVAKKLTKRIRRALRGETLEGFGRPLQYEPEYFA